MFSHCDSATPWTVAYQPPSMEFSKQDYWSGLLVNSQGIFLIQGSNPGHPCCRQMLYPLSHQGSLPDSLKIQLLSQSCSGMEEQNEPVVFFWQVGCCNHTGFPRGKDYFGTSDPNSSCTRRHLPAVSKLCKCIPRTQCTLHEC